MERGLKEFKKLFVEMFEKQSDFGLYVLNYQTLHDIAEDIQRFRTFSGSHNSLYHHLTGHIEEPHGRSPLSGRTQTMETVDTKKNSYDRSLDQK